MSESWASLRVDQLRLGDRIEWLEHHEGVLVVEHLGRAASGYVELGCDRWSVDLVVPGWERVRVYLSPPVTKGGQLP